MLHFCHYIGHATGLTDKIHIGDDFYNCNYLISKYNTIFSTLLYNYYQYNYKKEELYIRFFLISVFLHV